MTVDSKRSGVFMDRIEVDIDWQEAGPVTVDEGSALSFPDAPVGGGLYRFVFRLGERSRVYVGETWNFGKRFYAYRKPGRSQTTNQRMKDRFLRIAAESGSSTIEIATRVEVRAGGEQIEVDLDNVLLRRLIENAALVSALSRGEEVVNEKGFPPGELWDPPQI